MHSTPNLNRQTNHLVKACVVLTSTIVVAIAASLPACTSTDRAPLIFAAASLVDVMEEVATAYEADTGQKVRFNFAGSNLIANQIIAGAPADGVIVAGRTPIDKLISAGKMSNGDEIHVLSNRLVVVEQSGRQTSINNIEELVGAGRIAMPDPNTAPAGEYFQAALNETGLWEELQPQIIPALDARAALAAASTGTVAFALVYQTDAASTDNVQIAFTIQNTSNQTTPRYYAAPIHNNPQAKPFLQYLQTPKATTILTNHAFTP